MDDGRWWDSLLACWALLEAKSNPEKVSKTVDYMIKHAVQDNGGIAYGYDFEYAPVNSNIYIYSSIYRTQMIPLCL
jgi:hypothetical protein